MRLRRWMYLLLAFSFLWLVCLAQSPGANEGVPTFSLDLSMALARALQENPELKAKRHALGIAQGRVQQAELFFQDNPHLSMDADYRHRKFPAPTGRSVADVEVRLLQEIEIAGQRGYRREAAAQNLAQAEWSVADAERLLRLEVTHAFYDLLAVQEKIAAQQQVLSTQETLLRAGLERFEREDISVLELDALRLDTDRVRSDLLNTQEEQVLKEKQLRLLLGLGEEGALVAIGDLLAPSIEQPKREKLLPQADLEACAVENRPDLHAARSHLEVREAELRLAQARRIPNISLGPLYKLDNEDQVVGGAITIPLPFFHRNQQEIATALANLEIARTEFVARRLIVRQEVTAAYARVRLAEERLASYGTAYLDNLQHSGALTQKAYESGEMSIFEFSVAQDRLAQTRFRYLDALLASLRATAELEGQAAFCPAGVGSE